MKKLLTFLTLFTLFCGVGWAATASFVFSSMYSDDTDVNGVALSPTTGSNVIVTFNIGGGQSAPKYFKSGSAVRVYTNNTIVIDAGSNTISSITFTCNTENYANILKNATFSNGTASVSNTTVSLSSVNSSSVTVTNTGNQTRINTIVVTYTTGGTNVAEPTISLSPEGPYFKGDEVTASFSCTTTGATILYNINNTGWENYNGGDNISIPSTTVGIVNIQAKATLGNDVSSIAEENVTFGPTASTVSEMLLLGNNTTFKFTGNLVVSGHAGSNIYAQDATGGIHIYNNTNGSSLNYQSGSIIPAGFVARYVADYHGARELDQVSGMIDALESGNLPLAHLTPDQVTLENPFIYAVIENATITLNNDTKFYINVNGESVVINKRLYSNNVPEDGKRYNVYGVTSWYGGKEFLPTEFEEVQEDPGDGYYLVGNFNMLEDGTTWITKDARYKFSGEGTTLTLPSSINLPDNVQFKIVKWEGTNQTWYGGQTGDTNQQNPYGLHRNWHTGIQLTNSDNNDYVKNFFIAAGAVTNFTLYTNNLTFDVQRDEQLYAKGDFNNWGKTAMTSAQDVWTINQAIEAGKEFGFVDEWGDWYGGNGYYIYQEEHYFNNELQTSDIGKPLTISNDGNFHMVTAGTYTLNVNSDLSTLTVYVPLAINCTATSDVEGKAGGTIVAKVNDNTAEYALTGEKVTLDVRPWNGYTLSSITLNGNAITEGDNGYSFDMPNVAANVVANFTVNYYDLVLQNDETLGEVSGLPQNMKAYTGQTVSFSVTALGENEIDKVTYEYNNGNPQTLTATDGTYSFDMPPFPVTVVVSYQQQSSGGTGEWTLVTDAEEHLKAGQEYIIVVQNLKNGNNYLGSYALTTQVTSNYLKATNDIELGENYLTAVPGDAVAIFTLEGSEDNWKFKNGENYLYNFNTSKNYLGLGTPENGEGVFSITIGSNNVASIVENVDNRGLYCLPNVSGGVANPYFSLYQNAQINGVHLYYRGEATLSMPVINPASKVFTEEFDATITCSTSGATIHYTTDGTDPTINSAVYSNPIHIDQTTTLKAIAEKDGEVSGIAEAVYQCTMVENIAEYLALPIGTEDIVFKNPVVVQYHYISSSGKSYIYVKDESGCAYFHQPYVTEGTPSMDQLENGDVIGARFYGDKEPDEAVGSTQSIYSMFTNLQNFAPTGNKALAEPELKVMANITGSDAAELNNHYITINKVTLTDLYDAGLGYGGSKYFDINGVEHIGYNKFNIDYASVVDDLDAYYNITGIFTAYNNNLEFHPTEIVKWAEKEITLKDLCENGDVDETYTLTDNLHGVHANGTSLWVKDETGNSIKKTSPADGERSYYIDAIGNTRTEQADYDQSNWLEVVFPDAATAKSFEKTIIEGYSIKGVFNNKTNPKLTLTSDAIVKKYGDADEYAPNYYCMANFADWAEGADHLYQTGNDGNNYFFMNPKPQEFAMITWAMWNGEMFVIPANAIVSVNDVDYNVNYWDFDGAFIPNWSMNATSYTNESLNESLNGHFDVVYQFNAIIRKVETETGSKASEGVSGKENQNPSTQYTVYPLNFTTDQSGVITAVNDVKAVGEVESVTYFNVAGMQSSKPFDGINIVVTRYTDGSISTTKVIR